LDGCGNEEVVAQFDDIGDLHMLSQVVDVPAEGLYNWEYAPFGVRVSGEKDRELGGFSHLRATQHGASKVVAPLLLVYLRQLRRHLRRDRAEREVDTVLTNLPQDAP